MKTLLRITLFKRTMYIRWFEYNVVNQIRRDPDRFAIYFWRFALTFYDERWGF